MSILLSLLGFGKLVGAFLAKLPWQLYAAIAGVLLALFAWHSVYVSSFNKGYNVAWAHEQRTIAAVRVAAKKATADQIAANARPATISKQIAETSNAEAKVYYDKGRAAGAAYAAAHLVRGAGAAAERPSGRPDLP